MSGLPTCSLKRTKLSHFSNFFRVLFLGAALIATAYFPVQSQQASHSPSMDQPSGQTLKRAIALAQAGRLAEAEEKFKQLASFHPEDPYILTGLGQVEVQQGKLTEGLETFRKVVALDPKSADAHVNLAITLGEQSALAAALQESLIAVKLAPNSASAHFVRARLLSTLGRRTEAREEFRKVLSIQPRSAEALRYWAALEGDDGNIAEQEKLLLQYLKLRPDEATSLFQLGKILQQEHRDPEAIAAWRSALTLNPRYSEALYNLGRALRQTDPEESKRLFGRLSELEHDRLTLDRIKILGNQANTGMAEEHYKEAIDQLNQAIVLCGMCDLRGPLERNLGLAYCRSGALDDCERELKVAEKLQPDDPSIEAALQLVKQERVRAQGTSPTASSVH